MYWLIGILGVCLAGYSSKAMMDYLNGDGPKSHLTAFVTIAGSIVGVGMFLYGIGLIS